MDKLNDKALAERIMCETCGERGAYYFGGHAALCIPCLADASRSALSEAGLGDACGQLLCLENGNYAICFVPFGTEHDHDF